MPPRWLYVLALTSLVMLVLGSTLCFASSYVLYILGDPSCPACTHLKEFLDSHGLNYVFCPIYGNETCTKASLILLKKYGLPPYIPTTLVISDGYVKAVVIGAVADKSFWLNLAFSPPHDYVPVFMGEELGIKLNVSPKQLLKELLPNLAPSTTTTAIPKQSTIAPILLATLVSLALSDAVNPCATYIYILLLTASALVAVRSGRKFVIVGTSAAFISAVFIGYYLLGIGLLRIMGYVPTWVLALIAIGFGLWVIISGLRRTSRVIAKASMLNLIRKAKASIAMSAVLGFIVTFTLLPCSSGPYVVFTGLLSRYPLTTSLALLALYNLIFVTPLIIITALISSIARVKRVQEFIVSHDRELSVIAGILLVLIGIYILLMH